MIKIAMFRPEGKSIEYSIEDVEVINIPVTKIVDTNIDILNFLKSIGPVDYLIFTSTLAAQKFRRSVHDQFDPYLKQAKEVIAIGAETAKAISSKVSVVPPLQSTAGIAEYLKSKSGSALLVRSRQGNPVLVQKLSSHMSVYVLNIYSSQQLAPDQRHMDFSREIANKHVDALIFTSSMITTSFYNIFSGLDSKLVEHLAEVIKIAIGKETENTMISLNLVPDHTLSKPEILKAIKIVKDICSKRECNKFMKK
ncbi:MAG: uroporphyrinogen-III synthase [Thermoplasmata archaeon]